MDNSTQTPNKQLSPATPDAPMKSKMGKPSWMDSGRDIRRNLFAYYDWGKMEDVKYVRWAILRVDTIATSSGHRCIRRFYIGDKDGDSYLEMEFYPCTTYSDLSDECKEQFNSESSAGHGLRYNPYRASPPCSVAVSKIKEFISYNDIELILFNVERDTYHEKIDIAICDELKVQYLNIRWVPGDYTPILERQLAHDEDLTFTSPEISWTNEAV